MIEKLASLSQVGASQERKLNEACLGRGDVRGVASVMPAVTSDLAAKARFPT